MKRPAPATNGRPCGRGLSLPTVGACLVTALLALSACDRPGAGEQPADEAIEQSAPGSGEARASSEIAAAKENEMTTEAAGHDAVDEKAALLRAVGGECADLSAGKACFAGDYDLELIPGCGDGGFFAGVSNDAGALLVDRAPPDDTRKIATLAKGQFVCIEAIARARQEPAYYYVTTVPVEDVDACAGNELCEAYGDREITWHVDPSKFEGRRPGPQPSASGWIDANDLDVFSNGLDP